MPSGTHASKNQLILPAEQRRELRLQLGDRIDFGRTAEGDYRPIGRSRRFGEPWGRFEYPAPALDADAIDRALDRARDAVAEDVVVVAGTEAA